MRVLMLSKACIVGIYQRKLERMAQKGLMLRVLVPPSWVDERGEQKLERLYTQGYDLRAIPIRFNGSYHLHHYPTLWREMRDFAPDWVYIDEEPYNLATWQALYCARRCGARALFFSWQNIQRRYPPPFSWGERWVLRQADFAVMGTQSAADVWRAKGYTGPYVVQPQFGTDTTLFAPQPRPPRPFTIGYIGRMVEEKGLYVLFDALAGLEGDWRLRMVGGGPLVRPLQARAAASGIAQRITWVPQVPSREMAAQYAHLDALVLPSLTRPNWKEQFGRVLVEAMACALPVVGSDSGAIPGVIGDAGLVVPEGRADALQEALARLLGDEALRAALGQRARARAVEMFSLEAVG
jgi:glycosyltransferase involved in cell wall biosynthesis